MFPCGCNFPRDSLQRHESAPQPVRSPAGDREHPPASGLQGHRTRALESLSCRSPDQAGVSKAFGVSVSDKDEAGTSQTVPLGGASVRPCLLPSATKRLHSLVYNLLASGGHLPAPNLLDASPSAVL